MRCSRANAVRDSHTRRMTCPNTSPRVCSQRGDIEINRYGESLEETNGSMGSERLEGLK
jgi:hypothetical protein